MFIRRPRGALGGCRGGAAVSDRSTVLVCDDDSQSRCALRVVLHAAGFDVHETRTAREALNHAALRAPDAAILEVVLLDGDGVDVCRRLREWTAMPLIIVSKIDEEDQKVRALQAGADDYLTKPFGARELVARLRATQRRASRGDAQPRVVVDGLEINLAEHVVRRAGREVHLTPIEYKLLRLLIQNRGRLLTHRALLRGVWGTAYEGDRQTLRAHIANLRRKIEPAEGPLMIVTHPGVGYRFTDSHPGTTIPLRSVGPALDTAHRRAA
jgi:two-component system KDP operon response regulator KdpE